MLIGSKLVFSDLIYKTFLENRFLCGGVKFNWISWNKSFSVEFFNNECIFSFSAIIVILRKALFFIFKLFQDGINKRVLFVSDVTDIHYFELEKLRCQFSVIYNQPFALKWIPGLLTNSRSVITFWRNVPYQKILSTKNSLRLFWTYKTQSGLRRLNVFPSLILCLNCVGNGLAAVGEAYRMGIPSLGVFDSSTFNPYTDYAIRGNGNSLMSTLFLIRILNEAIVRGYSLNLRDLSDDIFITYSNTYEYFLYTETDKRLTHIKEFEKKLSILKSSVVRLVNGVKFYNNDMQFKRTLLIKMLNYTTIEWNVGMRVMNVFSTNSLLNLHGRLSCSLNIRFHFFNYIRKFFLSKYKKQAMVYLKKKILKILFLLKLVRKNWLEFKLQSEGNFNYSINNYMFKKQIAFVNNINKFCDIPSEFFFNSNFSRRFVKLHV